MTAGATLPTPVTTSSGAWRPACWLGAPAPGGLALPAAQPTASQLYAPRGVWLDDDRLFVCDSGNHRVLIWDGLPDRDRPADVVLGQPDMQSAAENRGGPPGPNSFRWPHAIAGTDERLFVADAGDHRVLSWAGRPDSDTPADLVLGQPDFTTTAELPHRPQGAGRLRFPYGVAVVDDLLAVADTANNRVLLWQLPSGLAAGAPAAAVLGQDEFDSSGENRWRAVTPDSLCWPYGICLHRGADGAMQLAVADSGNNRVMVWTARGV